MSITKIKEILKRDHIVNLYDLAKQLDTDPDTTRKMLEIWIRKGNVKKIQDTEVKCDKCDECRMVEVELYEWVKD